MSIQVQDFPDGVREITIANATRGNALTMTMLVELASAFRSASSSAKCVVLKGCPKSKSFCTGIELASAEEVFSAPERGDGGDSSDPVSAMEACAVPIVGVAHGACVNAGFEILLACDVLICSSDAKFVDTHAKIGIIPSWGLSVKLSRVIGSNAAKACSVFGEVIDAQRALTLGLAHRVTSTPKQAKEAACELARRTLVFPPGGASAVKNAIDDGLLIRDVRAEERRRAFAQYAQVARERFKMFTARRSKL